MRIAISLLSVVALGLCAWAQDVAQSSEESSVHEPVQIPLLKQNSLALISELERSNYVSAGVSAGMTFDDNALNASNDHSSNLADSFSGNISLAQTRSRLRWDLSYGGGVILNQNIHTDLEPAHDLSLNGQYRLSPHVTILINEHFLRTTGLYYANQGLTPFFEGLQGSNQTAVLPLSKMTGNTSSAELGYQFGRNSKVGMSGDFNLQRYSDEPIGTSPLVDSNTLGADAFYVHRLAAKNWAGVLYRYQKFTFPSLPNRTVVHSILLMDTMSLSHHMEISLFAGPEQVNNTVPVSAASTTVNSATATTATSTRMNWSPAAGGSFSMNGVRTSFVADATRMVDDGGGLLGTVQLTSVSVNIRHQFTGSFFGGGGLLYGDSKDVSGSGSSFSSLQVYGAVSRALRNNVTVTLGYSLALQQEALRTNGSKDINHNRAWGTVSYNFTRPLGK